MNLITTDDLVQYALWLAGEPIDGTSDYNSIVLTHMQNIYNTFTNGGTIGTRDVAQAAGLYEHLVDIPTTDWLWLRKLPPYAFTTTPAMIGSASSIVLNQGTQLGTASVVYGSPTITFSVAPPVSVAAWRFKPLTQAQGVANPPVTVPRISAHIANALTATMDVPWNQDTQVFSNYALYQAEYPLPADFVRFIESPQVQSGWQGMGSQQPRMAVGSVEQALDQFPITGFNLGPPQMAGRMNDTTFMVTNFDTFSYRCEFSYIFTPPVLATGVSQQPVIPTRYRQVLALGAAMLVTADKVDARTTSLASQFREIIHHMGIEFRKENAAGSELAGRHLYRPGGSRGRWGMLRTVSGLPLW